MGKILLFALLTGGVVQNLIVATSDCVEGCSVLRLHGLSRYLLHGLAPLYFWPSEELDLWLEVPAFSGFSLIRGPTKIYKWHEITLPVEINREKAVSQHLPFYQTKCAVLRTTCICMQTGRGSGL
ncbi:uncharacterized protein LOC119596772 [Penaeus monodon]|uniref:uncharacterized protein LOC119596772 n=1 Tax=Penaeus monodon TaxID=6687 RepID=UPI0018A74BA2|nr:uncharacterized protein LOC119596772 [Penaeus monodon]